MLALLGRFEMTYEHSMKDASEKERVTNLVLGLGQDAVKPLDSSQPKAGKLLSRQ